ncbi:MAG TPA: hypothetical protein VGO58_15935 [Chitinophagaceae bacterium]|jgi:hypothetical protein|nr:hypothetical protein [Chitinophagaceae bacterium]
MVRLIVFLLLIPPQLVSAQEKPCYRLQFDGDTANVFTRMNTPAQFKGGQYAWNKFVGSHTRYNKLMPDSTNDFKDSITLRFIVSKEGVLSNIEILQDGRPEIREEAIWLVIASCEKKWIPGIDNSGAYRNSWVAMKFYFYKQADTVGAYTVSIDP